MKYRPGDVLLVRATVVEAQPVKLLHLKCASGVGFCAADSDIALPEHQPVEVGDDLRLKNSLGRVIAIRGNFAWVEAHGPTLNLSLQTWRISDCERVD